MKVWQEISGDPDPIIKGLVQSGASGFHVVDFRGHRFLSYDKSFSSIDDRVSWMEVILSILCDMHGVDL
jgi:hypothetical protein